MPAADVVIVGGGLAGLACAVRLAEGGAHVVVVAAGQAALTWAAGPLDIAAPPGAASAADGVRHLAGQVGHPYAVLHDDVGPALAWFTAAATGAGLAYAGDLERPLWPLPTALGTLRPAGIVPHGMAGAAEPWRTGERLVVVGLGGFKDLWPAAVAGALRASFALTGTAGPQGISGLMVDLPELADRRNLTALDLARLLDRPADRAVVLGRVADAVAGHVTGAYRVALPAVLGLEDHVAALTAAAEAFGAPVFELPLVPPSVPGLRLHALLRRLLLRAGGRILLGAAVARVEVEHGRVARVVLPAAARETVIRTPRLVLATGGLAGGGIVAEADGHLRETVLGLPVAAPPPAGWLAADAFHAGGHPIAAAGLETDASLHPAGGPHGVAGRRGRLDDVWAVGGLLAGQRYLRERCGDGVALASAWRVAGQLLGERKEPARAADPAPAVAA